MAKFVELHEDLEAIFRTAIDAVESLREVTITLIGNERAKDIFKITKANDLLKFRTNDDIIIVVNEKSFEQLPPEFQRIVADEAITYISYNSEDDKVSVNQPDFTAHTGVLRKYGFELIERVRESVKSLYDAEKEAEEANKQTTK